MKPFTVDDLLDNAAAASQQSPIMEDPVVRGAILRSIYQWLQHAGAERIPQLMKECQDHKDFYK